MLTDSLLYQIRRQTIVYELVKRHKPGGWGGDNNKGYSGSCLWASHMPGVYPVGLDSLAVAAIHKCVIFIPWVTGERTEL